MRFANRVLLRLLLSAPFVPAGVLAAQLPDRWTAPGLSGSFGADACAIDDRNGDGIDDVVVGDPLAYPSGLGGDGAIHWLSGADGSLLQEVRGSNSEDLGLSLDVVGDVDGDGTSDIVVGSVPNYPLLGSGKARLFSGRTGELLATVSGALNFGTDVAGIGDTTGDGVPDFAVGDPGPSQSVSVRSGSDASEVYSVSGSILNQGFGASVAGVGDVNGDGVPDIAVGTDPFFPFGADPPGAVAVLSGADGTLIHLFLMGQDPDFGRSVVGAGDVNRDGFPDILVGRHGSTSSPQAIVYSGVDGTILRTVDASPSTAGRVDGGADLNGDGTPDIAFGSAAYSGAEGIEWKSSQGSGRFLILPDLEGDGFAEILDTTPSAAATLTSIGGALPYGTGLDPSQTLTTYFVPGTGPAGTASGSVFVSGANPFAVGVGILSFGSGMSPLLGTLALVDLSPGNFLSVAFSFDANGTRSLPLDLRRRILSMPMAYIQFLEVRPGPQLDSSNGLAVLFAP